MQFDIGSSPINEDNNNNINNNSFIKININNNILFGSWPIQHGQFGAGQFGTKIKYNRAYKFYVKSHFHTTIFYSSILFLFQQHVSVFKYTLYDLVIVYNCI